MIGNPALVAAGGGYMYPMLAGVLAHGGMGVGAAGLSVPGNYFRGQSLPNAYPDSDTGKRGAGKDSDAGGSFQGYSNYSLYANC
ncbi:hypothetical protein CARUB_v10018725mg [Capsella rubella]|uniref:Uncharacterized protein n=1 Tax=Capsella rubella TaxID=81985 RepID=R0HNA1_9BRAS|nr:hypothetical protein CARUB_v10018725mg [Capsella rubella]